MADTIDIDLNEWCKRKAATYGVCATRLYRSIAKQVNEYRQSGVDLDTAVSGSKKRADLALLIAALLP